MAGKLNYTKRKSEGVKLGLIVAKDVRKLVYGGSLGGSSAKGGTQRKIAQLDINVQGKDLTDEGLEAIVLALEEVLELGESIVRLEEINLSGNKLTSVSLRRLARVIELASYDLRNIDLSENEICIRTSAQGSDWESFWESFHSCAMLRRIDVSHNDLSGPLPFELLWKCYCRQPAVDPTDFPRNGLPLPYHDASLQDATNQKMAELSIDDPAVLGGSPSSMSNAMIMKRRRGLRSVPYIVLNDTQITDSGALHLSYVLQQHYYPQQLDPLGGTRHQSAQLEEHAQTNSSWGLVYKPNESLSPTGFRVLSLAETQREGLLHGDDAGASVSNSYEVVSAKQASPLQSRISPELGNFKNQGNTMLSLTDSGPGPSTFEMTQMREAPTGELDSLRKKLQRSTILELGARSSPLWSAALKSLYIYRLLQLRTSPVGSPRDSPQASASGFTKTSQTSLITKQRREQKRQQEVPHAAFQDRIKDSKLRQRYIDFATDPNLPGRLPALIWQRIVEFTLLDSTGGARALSDEQQRAVRRWATDRRNMTDERRKQLKIKNPSIQIWSTLECMGCLTYDFSQW